jgi:hypothetical protein
MTSLRKRAETKATEQLATIRARSIFRDTYHDYTKLPEENLIQGVEKQDFWSDLGAGAGNELVDDSKGPAKFCAAYSSSALAVNAFGPFRHAPGSLEILGYSEFTDTQFEKPLPTGLRGTDPHLDFYAQGRDQIVCIESKFLEPLHSKVAKFADSYEGAIASLAEPCWAEVYKGLKQNPRQFKYLDTAQLVKHYLGMRNTLGHLKKQLVLFYVYWEPTNASELAEYRQHREEVSHLSNAVASSQLRFTAKSYNELWAVWESTSSWSGMPRHVERLRERYRFAV